MKYIKEFTEHSTYEEIWTFMYGESPTYDEIKTLTIHDVNNVNKVINEISHSQLKYRSKPELRPFWFLNWPIWLRGDSIDIYDDNQVKWVDRWKEILDDNGSNYETSPIYQNKQIRFECQTYDRYFYGVGYRMFDIDIMKDDNHYYYVNIKLQGDQKYYKCDQEYGLSDCLKTELKNWKFR